ncbi:MULTISPECIES: type II toxin-antitoxin system RelE/ParE family toxin [unclassified Mameliella]|uniref:type II toxin-antitoxin system RelE/ParE family toxin n=1 Tax=unclassified Mameliella TaxID=2630630 RepID=UPI00273D12B3|nr:MULTISPECIES: type II toxin-antitoxin system RelE/ParE family toxin [unclassified Mameliella]
MAYKVLRAADVAVDLDLIFDFLVAAAEAFGDDTATAFARAEERLNQIEADMAGLGRVPHQGTLRPHLGDGIRNVTKGRAVYYFDVDDDRRILRVLAVFFGGQDHDARILLRLLGQG